MIKAFGGLLQNTIEPMIKEVSDILWFMESKGIPIEREMLESLAKKAVLIQLSFELIRGLTQIIIAVIICYTALRIF